MRDLILDATNGREFDIAQRYCGIAPGRCGDREHHQPCPFCEGKDRFWFYPKTGTFHCRQCEFGGNIIDLLITVNRLTFRQAIEILAADLGIILPEPQKHARSPQKTTLWSDWENSRQDARMTIASLTLAYMRFVPATDGVDFLEATLETTREYAIQLVDYPLREIVEMLAINKCQGDRQEAWLVLDCLYTGKEIKSALVKHRVERAIQEIRMFVLKERRSFEKEIENRLKVVGYKRRKDDK